MQAKYFGFGNLGFDGAGPYLETQYFHVSTSHSITNIWDNSSFYHLVWINYSVDYISLRLQLHVHFSTNCKLVWNLTASKLRFSSINLHMHRFWHSSQLILHGENCLNFSLRVNGKKIISVVRWEFMNSIPVSGSKKKILGSLWSLVRWPLKKLWATNECARM